MAKTPIPAVDADIVFTLACFTDKSRGRTIAQFATVKEAEKAMTDRVWKYVAENDIDKECVHNGIDDDGLPFMCVDDGSDYPEYRVFKDEPHDPNTDEYY